MKLWLALRLMHWAHSLLPAEAKKARDELSMAYFTALSDWTARLKS